MTAILSREDVERYVDRGWITETDIVRREAYPALVTVTTRGYQSICKGKLADEKRRKHPERMLEGV